MLGTTLMLSFAAGMVATFNPCGFSLLPAYVGAFVAGDEMTDRMDLRIRRAIGAAAAMSVSFVLVFAIAGVAVDALADQVRQQLPLVTIGIGVLLAGVGVAMVSGWKPAVAIPMFNFKRRGGRVGGMVTYGATFALVSLSCTLGPFLAVTGTALSRSPLEGVVTYAFYGLGMGFVVLAISMASALTRDTVVSRVRGISAHVPRIGGALMILAGAYVIWYARWELAVFRGDPTTDPIIDGGEAIRLWFVDLIESMGPTRFALVVALALIAGAWAARGARRDKRTAPETGSPQPEDPATVSRGLDV